MQKRVALLMQTHYSDSGANTIVWRRGGSFEHTLAPIAVKVLACPTWKLLRVRSPTWVSTFFFLSLSIPASLFMGSLPLQTVVNTWQHFF